MEFSFSEQQNMLRTSARQFLERECPPDVVRRLSDDPQGFSPDLWRKMAELGWMGLVLPETYGGSGLSFVDLTILMEEMGRVLLPAPFFSSIALGALALLEAGSEEQRHQMLPPLARGEVKLCLALLEADGRYDPRGIALRASIRGNRAMLNGIKLFVVDAHLADYVICVARTRGGRNPESGISLFLLDMNSPGVVCTPLVSIDQTRRLCEVSFARVGLSLDAMLGGRDTAWPMLQGALDRATVALCAEMVGGAERAMEMCVDYGKTRIQFGRQVGGFQAVKHKIADMKVWVENAKSVVSYAAWAVDSNAPEAARAASMAKAYCSEMYSRVTADGVQVHGGIGFTWDHNMHLYFKRAKSSEVLLGDAAWHRERIAALIPL
ncbi:MAG TPA: acyl-CoA dehydrogenase family protein [Candidatus Tectomicrobia bacterium]|nr:acyl-CoA dehydrogenase family protein [Candidatus Tectomicrobia bacterium]